ncbi:MAG: Thioredoxin [Candidatus Carbobacillus altaicus]|uniref:Thioredoxin n=1 Tax=Candidatus Carbonibacillus altaicus TaxID=2163959 RepID=A0A2R6Y302_9BACL|nr:MAG: Thioredoxin [Candidatus Carbobacillus altaicus]
MARTFISVIILLAFLGGALYVGLNQSTATEERAEVGYRAPSFQVETPTGETLDVGTLIGTQPVFINFFESWCPPCRAEMPHIQEAYTQYGDKVAFIILDPLTSESLKDMLDYIEEEGFTFPVYIDDNKATVARMYRVGAFPTSFFINKKGEIVNMQPGAMTKDYLEAMLEQLSK